MSKKQEASSAVANVAESFKSARQITLFSNGIGHFQRLYRITGDKPENISIPFRKDHVGDVSASLQVRGNVRYNRPATFTPSNSDSTALKINQNSALLSMLTGLSGARVSVTIRPNPTPKEYTLLGVDSEETYTSNGNVKKDYVILQDGHTVQRAALSEITSVEFTEPVVQSEIEKALKNNYQKIKPDSTFVDLSISSKSGDNENAVVQYAIPVAPWSMRYSIRQDNGSFSLEGTAIVHNNTDEDWDNATISVVTGNPISFATNLADVVIPQRQFVNVIDGQVLGNVNVQEGYQMNSFAGLESAGRGMVAMAACAAGGAKSMKRSATRSSYSNTASFGLESCDAGDFDMEEAAAAPGVDSKEVGDFCVFTSKEPISIASKKSAIVPMFTVPLSKAGLVLLYKEENHSRRPFRAVKFKNETEYSLGKGKVVIYQDGVFSGECVMDAAKPGDNRMLPHCLENGVRIIKESKNPIAVQKALKFSAGVAFEEKVWTRVTTYTIENKKKEAFKLLVEHVRGLNDDATFKFDGVEVQEQEKLDNGVRVYFNVKESEKLKLTVTETQVQSNKFSIADNYYWINQSVIEAEHPLASDKGILACAATQQVIDDLDEEIQELQTQSQDWAEQAQRVRENIKATKDESASQIRNQWITDLDESEKQIRKINKELVPKLETKRKEATAKLGEQLRKLTANWKA